MKSKINILLPNEPSRQNTSYKDFVYTAEEHEKEIRFAREKRLKDEASRLECAYQKGFEIGQHRVVVKTAKIIKEGGVTTDIIMKITALTEKEIENL